MGFLTLRLLVGNALGTSARFLTLQLLPGTAEPGKKQSARKDARNCAPARGLGPGELAVRFLTLCLLPGPTLVASPCFLALRLLPGTAEPGKKQTARKDSGQEDIWATGRLATGHCETERRATGRLATGHCETERRATGHLATGHCETERRATGRLATGRCETDREERRRDG